MSQTLLVVRNSLWLLMRHWPTLLALCCAGYIARQVGIRVAVYASDVHGVLGMLVFALVPLALLVTLLLMLRVLAPSLPAVSAAMSAGGRMGVLAHVASVLVPFVVVYASLEMFVDDRNSYVNQVLEDEHSKAEIFTDPSVIDTSARLAFALSWVSVVVTVMVFLGRYLIGLWRSGRDRTPVRLFAAYLEVVWISLAVVTFSAGREWAAERQFVFWVGGVWQSVVEAAGPLAGLARAVGEGLVSADTVLLVPLAWLAIAAVLYGGVLAPREALSSVATRRRLLRMPKPLRSDVSASFGPLLRGVALLRRGGLGPMLLFCLVFWALDYTSSLLWQVERALIGPRDLESVWMPLSAPLGALNNVVTTVWTICLVAAAVDRVLTIAGSALAQGEPGVAGQVGAAGDAHGGGPRVAGRDEESRGLVTI